MQTRRRRRSSRGNGCRLTPPPARGAALQLPRGPARPEGGPWETSGGAPARTKAGKATAGADAAGSSPPGDPPLLWEKRAAAPLGLRLCYWETTVNYWAWQGRGGPKGAWRARLKGAGCDGAWRSAKGRGKVRGDMRTRAGPVAVGRRLSGGVEPQGDAG